MVISEYKLNKILMGRLQHQADLLEEINKTCKENNIKAGLVSVIGAVSNVKLGFYDQKTHKYSCFIPGVKGIGIKEKDDRFTPFEIVGGLGNISLKDGEPFAHIHLIVSDKEGKTYGGHLMPGTSIFAAEIIIQSFDGPELYRGFDQITGLPLWCLQA